MDQDKQHIERLQIINDEQAITIYNLQSLNKKTQQPPTFRSSSNAEHTEIVQ
jgi:hypothetical protein